ncbi:MAG: hypothetical protein OXH24_10765 [Cyanobacteria bacterium MAG IRC3_bin_20]|nr:hypothetical protein [Cyanobacteria bacterium MAG IRC3_bin_20]
MSNCDCDPFFVATLRVAIGAHTNKLRIAALPRFATLPAGLPPTTVALRIVALPRFATLSNAVASGG